MLLGVVIRFVLWLVAQMFICATILLRYLPGLWRAACWLLRAVAVGSFWWYRLLLSKIRRTAKRAGIDPLKGVWRVGACVSLSLAFGSALLFVLSVPFTVISVGVLVLHGLYVGIIWNDVYAPTLGLNLGVRLS